MELKKSMEVSEQDSTQSGTVESSEDQFTRVSMNKTLFNAKLLRSMICAVMHLKVNNGGNQGACIWSM